MSTSNLAKNSTPSPTKNLNLEHVNCGVCGADNHREYATGADYEYHTSGDRYCMVECLECGNIYLNPRPVTDELATIYPPNYYAYNYDEAINPIAIAAKNWLDGGKVQQWLKYLDTPTPQVLDVGCGNGRYLKMLHRLGIPKTQLYGVELDAKPIDQLNAEGFQGYCDRIENLSDKLPQASFDLIVMLQVIEHVSQPRDVIACLAKLLKPGGILVIETPNTNSIDAQMFRKGYWGGYHFPRHWNLLNKSTLTRLAQEQELEIAAFNFLPSQSFWIYSLHHFITDKWQLNWLANWFNPLQNLALLTLFTSFDIARAKLGFATSNIQAIAKKPQI